LETLRLAQSLNTQPWKLVGGSRLLWYARAQAVRNSEISRDRKRVQESERKMREMENKRRNK
jgi:hypothetical protein